MSVASIICTAKKFLKVAVADSVPVAYKRRIRWQPFLDGVLARADRPVQQRGTATPCALRLSWAGIRTSGGQTATRCP